MTQANIVQQRRKTFNRGLASLRGYELPEAESELREYFASRSKIAKGNSIEDEAWRRRKRYGVVRFDDVEFVESVFGRYGIKNPWD